MRTVRNGFGRLGRTRSATILLLCGGLALAGCGSSGQQASPAPSTVSHPAASTAPSTTASSQTPQPAPSQSSASDSGPSSTPTSGYTDASFAKGKCVASGGTDADSEYYREVDCADASAVATVLSRSDFGDKGTRCPPGATNADEMIHLQQVGKSETDYGKKIYADVCLRNLKDPHPGDPGQGGGPDIVKGDCLVKARSSSAGTVAETVVESPCVVDTSRPTALKPDYRVIETVPLNLAASGTQADCPAGTQVQFTEQRAFSGDIYCAVPL